MSKDLLASAIEDMERARGTIETLMGKPHVPEILARQFHEAYERLAPKFGYETRPDTKEFDPASKNGRLMVAVCAEIISAAKEEPAAQPEGYQLVPVVATMKIESAIAASRNLKASEIWEDALSAAKEEGK